MCDAYTNKRVLIRQITFFERGKDEEWGIAKHVGNKAPFSTNSNEKVCRKKWAMKTKVYAVEFVLPIQVSKLEMEMTTLNWKRKNVETGKIGERYEQRVKQW